MKFIQITVTFLWSRGVCNTGKTALWASRNPNSWPIKEISELIPQDHKCYFTYAHEEHYFPFTAGKCHFELESPSLKFRTFPQGFFPTSSPPPVFLVFLLSLPVVLYFVSFRPYTLMEGILLLWIYESKCILQRIPAGIICPLTLFNLYYWHIQGCLTPTRKKTQKTTHINLQKCVLTCLLKMKMDVLWEITWVLL